jgi:excinuclease ABC subunit C
LQQIRDEAHRFAITFHRELRGKRMTQSELTAIPGVGRKTVQKMFDRFGSVNAVQEASLQQLQEALGAKTGQTVHTFFHGDGTSTE